MHGLYSPSTPLVTRRKNLVVSGQNTQTALPKRLAGLTPVVLNFHHWNFTLIVRARRVCNISPEQKSDQIFHLNTIHCVMLCLI